MLYHSLESEGGRYLFTAHCGAQYEGFCLLASPRQQAEGLQYFLNQGYVWGNSPLEKLWNHLDNRVKCHLRSTKDIYLIVNTFTVKKKFIVPHKINYSNNHLVCVTSVKLTSFEIIKWVSSSQTICRLFRCQCP